MQIFVTNPSAYLCALNLYRNPQRANKMITETQQILACAQKKLYGKVSIVKVDGEFYKTPKSRENHPVVKWASDRTDNFKWLVMHLKHLYNLYLERFNRDGAFSNVPGNLEILLHQTRNEKRVIFDSEQFCNFAKADDKGLDFTWMENTFEAYTKFLEAQGDLS